MSGSKYIIKFDYRSDDGPRHVGPFYTRKAAKAWLIEQRFALAECDVVPLWQPLPSEQQ